MAEPVKPNPNDPTVKPPEDDDSKNQNDDQTADDDDDDPDEVAELRTQVRSLKAKLGAAKRAAKAAPKPKAKTTKDDAKPEDDGPSERERELEAQLEKTQAAARNLLAESLAGELDIVDPEAAVRLLDWDEIDDPDDRREVRAALKALKKEKPYLAKEQDTGAGGGGGSGPSKRTMNDFIRGSVRR
jgi:hypothetical protein